MARLNIPRHLNFQCDNGPEFKDEATKLLEKHNVDIQRVTAK